MQITATVPVEVDGKTVCEFDVEVDIDVTFYGSPPQTYGLPENCDPGEGPEWEELGCMVLATVFDKETNKYSTEEVECPEALKPYVEKHYQSQSYLDMVSCAIGQEEVDYDY